MNTSFNTLLAGVGILMSVASSTVAADVPPDIADMKVQDLRSGGDEKKRYFIIHKSAPPPDKGWRTLFVLPGGSGDAQFRPFVARIAKNALPDGYLVVQFVAPIWTAEQAKRIVWPDEQSGVPEMKFSTTDFFLAVRAEVAKAYRLDPTYSFTLTWSASGMRGYALSLLPEAGVTGTFVAMSAFRPAALPSLVAVKGHPYFILHSPQDFIPIAHAMSARESLQKVGALVDLQEYEGGHGWHGNVFAEIRRGIAYLEREASNTANEHRQ